jgi:hypothetical protein
MEYFTRIIIASFLIYLSSCAKDSFITGSEAEINFSEDSLYFDTLFTSTGSVTQYFKIYNGNDQKLRIGNISLGGGGSSYFKINADGFAGPQIRDIEMEANDSMYVFVTVSIDPSSTNMPFVIEDSINIQYNGNSRWVKLSAWGQNANFLNSLLINSNTTWTNERPYVILGGLGVDVNTTLTIQQGTKIYLHADAPLLIEGTLIANGDKYDSTKVIFQGDRLDDGYSEYPGAWPGIYFGDNSVNNVLKHVILKNAYQGIVAVNPAVNNVAKVSLRECVIENCYDAGIIGSATSIDAVNCVTSNCGKNIVLLKGGEYNFTHCTNVAISNNFIQHKQPVLAVTDYIKEGDNFITGDLAANFTNCIFWGDNGIVEDEVIVLKEGNNLFNVSFTNCLWKNVADPEGVNAAGIISNQDPLFMTIDSRERIYDFRLNEGSPALGAGVNAGTLTDIDGNERNTDNPDIGAFESTF